MGKKLSEAEINRRLLKLRNLERLHEKDQAVKAGLRAENKELKAANARLEAKIGDQAVLIAELQKAVFGKKRRGGGCSAGFKRVPKTSPELRNEASYRRARPDPASVTVERELRLEESCACGGTLRQTGSAVRFVEDIPLPELTAGYRFRLVTKYLIERGVCLACGKTRAAEGRDLSGQQVRLGKNLRLLVCHLISGGLSYAKTRLLIKSLYGIEISSGEIAGVLKQAHQSWQPAYQSLLTGIRASPAVHVDETPWPIRDLKGGGYAWVVSDENGRSCFALKNGRGGAHARQLLKGFAGVRITDNYAAYSNPDLAGKHQLCWAHLYRNIRDLRYNSNLPEEQAGYVAKWYEGFAGLYAELRDRLAEPAEAATRSKRIAELQNRLDRLLNVRPPKVGEPLKLSRLKEQLRKAGAANKLFVCLEEQTPCDNNRAERDLRSLVIKRKNSFGSVSEAGASALATVISLCANTWRTNPDNYFQTLAALG